MYVLGIYSFLLQFLSFRRLVAFQPHNEESVEICVGDVAITMFRLYAYVLGICLRANHLRRAMVNLDLRKMIAYVPPSQQF